MVVLNVHAWMQYPELSFWDTPWNIVNSSFTIVWIIFLVLLPIYGFIISKKNKEQLDLEENKESFGFLYEDNRYNSLHGALYHIRGMIRRLFMVLVITVFSGLPYFQIVFLTVLSFAELWFLFKKSTFTDKQQNKVEIFNEVLVYIAMWSSMNFQMANTD